VACGALLQWQLQVPRETRQAAALQQRATGSGSARCASGVFRRSRRSAAVLVLMIGVVRVLVLRVEVVVVPCASLPVPHAQRGSQGGAS
jgi:hypothetical protein